MSQRPNDMDHAHMERAMGSKKKSVCSHTRTRSAYAYVKICKIRARFHVCVSICMLHVRVREKMDSYLSSLTFFVCA